ncbi:hypothetical protein EJ02DRAFT_434183 [Clathrospora elynae]|uniref:Uncharacterized protein n=1 Tax=Clathrospora elynae TaxID=706981 RepID=A0A6A5SRE8_9PLEO|nr:hypothetical protein EJ02DRAFT_434183 [Clathrospora elynae]
MAPICRVRLLSDLSGQTVCDREAASLDGRLRAFHSQQYQSLYRGSKKRNTELDKLALPAYLASKKASVVAQDFTDINEEVEQIVVCLPQRCKYNLPDRVIHARKLHHRHFFAVDNDYGHEKYMNTLQNQKYNMVKSLEELGKRAAAVMYEKKQWFCWIKQF